MKVRIISDGTPVGTRIIDVETGRDLGLDLYITSVSWHVEVDGLATVTFEAAGVEIDAVGEVAP